MLHETLADNPEQSIEVMSDDIVSRYRSAKTSIPGIGHNLHKPQDPRATRLFKVAEEHGFSGRYVKLMKGIADAATRQFGKDLPSMPLAQLVPCAANWVSHGRQHGALP